MTDLTNTAWTWLDRRLAGELSETEHAELSAWCAEQGVSVEQVLEWERAVRMSSVPSDPFSASEFAERIRRERVRRERIEQTGALRLFHTEGAFREPSHARVRHWVWGGAAAVVALAVLGHEMTTAVRTDENRDYSSAAGKTHVVTLDDGVRMTLGPSTTVKVIRTHNDHKTTVRLLGEAIFVVPHAVRTPFIVQTSNATTRVLGTTFLVRQYVLEKTTRITVTDGRVSVGTAVRDTSWLTPSTATPETAKHFLVLEAHTKAVVSNTIDVARNVAVDTDTMWASGKLVFVNTPVCDVIAELRNVYNTRIQLEDSSLASHKLTWTVPLSTQTLDDVLETLGILVDARVRREAGVITITRGHGSSQNHDGRQVRPREAFSKESTYGK